MKLKTLEMLASGCIISGLTLMALIIAMWLKLLFTLIYEDFKREPSPFMPTEEVYEEEHHHDCVMFSGELFCEKERKDDWLWTRSCEDFSWYEISRYTSSDGITFKVYCN